MASSHHGAVRAGDPGGSAHIDWTEVERSPEFRELVTRRRRFVGPATAFFLGWYTLFIVLAGYAEGFMGEKVVGGVTIGYLFALSQFVMVWVLGALYLRRADREFDPLAERVVQRATRARVSDEEIR